MDKPLIEQMVDHVVSLNLAKKLAAKKYPENTIGYWRKFGRPYRYEWELAFPGIPGGGIGSIPAPMTDEILEELPPIIQTKSNVKFYFEVAYAADHKRKAVGYFSLDEQVLINIPALKTVDALAELWLWLKNNRYLS